MRRWPWTVVILLFALCCALPVGLVMGLTESGPPTTYDISTGPRENGQATDESGRPLVPDVVLPSPSSAPPCTPPLCANVYVDLRRQGNGAWSGPRALKLEFGAEPQPIDPRTLMTASRGTVTLRGDIQWYAVYLAERGDESNMGVPKRVVEVLLHDHRHFRVLGSGTVVDEGGSPNSPPSAAFDPAAFQDIAAYGWDPQGPLGPMINEDQPIIK